MKRRLTRGGPLSRRATGFVAALLAGSASLVAGSAAFAGDISYGTPSSETVWFSGSSSAKVDIVILGEGYTEAELAKYNADVSALVSYMFSLEPYASSSASFNIHKVNVISAQSGADEGAYQVNTAFDCSYSGRLILIGNFTNVSAAKAKAPASDTVMVLVNHATYGGAGYFSGYAVAYNGGWGNLVMMHEFGHSFGQLHDEYQNNTGSTYSGGDPAYVNLTNNSNPNTVKWSRHLGLEGVGLYEGGMHYDYGIYRPTYSECTMRSLQDRYCRVCRLDGLIPRIPAGGDDSTPPTVAFTAPADGATVSGSITLAADAGDAVGVVSVTFRVDGAWVGADTSAPYAVSWNTAAVANGAHVLTATAADAGGNEGTSTITVTVDNGAANQAPTAVVSASPTSGLAPLTVFFNGAGSFDPDGAVVSYAWDFGDGTTGSGPTVSHTYAGRGNYSAKLTVTDTQGATGSATVTITVKKGPRR
jgi:chitodextrinase